MKLCWDNIEKLILSKNGNFRIGSNIYILKPSCKSCKNPFLTRKQYESEYCCNSCAQSGENHWNNGNPAKNKGVPVSESQKKKISNTLKNTWKNEKSVFNSIEYRKKLSDSHKGKKSYMWKGGYKSKNIPLYDTYNDKISYCEKTRRNKNDKNILEVKCAYCGKWFIPKTSQVTGRIKALESDINNSWEHRLYCSENCKKECPTYGQRKYPKGFKKATSREVQPELRQMVLARDNYTCQKCEKTQDELDTGLHCHHYEGIYQNPIESADIDNCITLCKNCHKEIHKLLGCGYYDLRCDKYN